jgi:copper(I)-binding protein
MMMRQHCRRPPDAEFRLLAAQRIMNRPTPAPNHWSNRMSKLPIAAAVLALWAGAAVAATARDYKVGSIAIAQPWSRALPKGASVAVGYLKITNTGSEPDRLVGGSTPVASRFEIHEMNMDKGIMTMRPLPEGLEIKPGQTVELKPGATHVMMLDVKEPIERGKSFKASLKFEKAGSVDVDFAIQSIGATAPGAPSRETHAH